MSSEKPSPEQPPSSSAAPSVDGVHVASPAPTRCQTILSSTDAFLTRLYRCTSTRSGADVVLFFLTYGLRLSANVLETGSRAAIRSSASKLVALALQLPPSQAVNFAKEAPFANPFVGLALKLAARLRAAVAVLTEVRTFGRLWGLLGLYFSVKKLVLSARAKKQEGENSAERTFDFIVAAAQITSLISFQATENITYLSSKKILGFSPATQGKLIMWSVRSWALYVAMELARLVVERQRKVSAAGGRLTEKDQAWSEGWKREFFRNLAWSPVTVHFSIPGGFLSDFAVSALAFHPAQSQMRELWAANK
ncbi:uncharacterized protein J7T54_000295 [Emericellopsis cladophorae]|uniref:Peroxin 11C n=1 Tax=Emericellopsis cladophorae TaxID=2686198 RepID=A0A9Q0BCI9_9HYPO|nr:uncharacterized protein J7T54_000295 [Emericellopsis cladophorae]KAI6779149.1 hypothetical protein J7T54_000295 [Emericellopsis cladophorae]